VPRVFEELSGNSVLVMEWRTASPLLPDAHH